MLRSKKIVTTKFKRSLVNGNLESKKSFIPLNKSDQQQYFKKLRLLKKAAKKNYQFNNIDFALSFFNKLKYRYYARQKHIAKATANFSYDGQYFFKRAEMMMSKIIEQEKFRQNSMEALNKAGHDYLKQLKNKQQNKEEKCNFKKNVAHLKTKYLVALKQVKLLSKNKKISHNAAREEKNKLKIIFKGDKKSLSFTQHRKIQKEHLFYNFFKYLQGKKKINNVYRSRLTFLANSFPQDLKTPWRTYLSPIFEFIFPGCGSLLNKEYFKGIILSLVSAFLFTITVLFAAGIFQLEINGQKHGGGIWGLITLGSNAQIYQPDSRFYLIFGILSLILLIISLTYSVIFSRICYKKAKAMYLGYRLFGKIQIKNYLENNGFPYLIVTPIYVILTFTSIFPLLTSILIVFTNYGDKGHIAPVDLITWVGFDNLKEIFNFSSAEGKYFLKTLSWSFIWGIGSTLTATGAGAGLALLVNHPRLKGKKIIRVLFLLPTAIPFFIMVLYFKIFFGPSGTMNHDVIPTFLPWVDKTKYEIAPGIVQDFANISWFSDVEKIKALLFVINIWFGFAGMFLFITGLLQGLSKDLYEAAEVSGATSYRKFMSITAPIILYQISPLLIGSFIGGFNNFGLIYLFTEGGPHIGVGGPGETDILASYVFKLINDEGRPALAATYMFAIALIFGIFGVIGFSRTKTFRKGNY